MPPGDFPSFRAPPPPRWQVGVAAFALAGAALLAYANTFSAPLLFDDSDAILRNPSIRQLWPPWLAFQPATGGSTTAGRPFFNFTLALNYAVGGAAPRGYHLVNLALHTLAGLALFGVLRRTLQQPRLRPRFGSGALPLAATTALLWLLHPLQTESVTYLVQRAECLVSLCFLVTFYGFIRSVDDPATRRWPALTIVACTLGMASKEVMVSAPLLVWCYDRTFVSGSFGSAVRRRPRFYAALAATWLPLLYLLVSMGGSRGTTAGLGQGVSPWTYAVAQSDAIFHYLRLAGWPQPLVFDYGIAWPALGAVLPQFIALGLLVAAALIAFVRGTMIGFVAAFCLAVLAPSSSFVPITTQSMAEHRTYLALAGVLALAMAGIFALAGRRGLVAATAAALSLGLLTFDRNHDYRSEAAIWYDTTLKRPDNPRAFDNYGLALSNLGRLPEAEAAFIRALQLNPKSASSNEGLATVLVRLGRLADARRHFLAAAQIDPLSASAHAGAGAMAAQLGDHAAAIPSLEVAIRLDPAKVDYHRTLAAALFAGGRLAEAIARFQEALRLAPTDANLHSDLGGIALVAARLDLARAHTLEAIRLDPALATARNNLAAVLNRTGQPAEALTQAEAALRGSPRLTNAHFNAAEALAVLGRVDEAMGHFRAELELNPQHVGANLGLGFSLLQRQQPAEAQRFLAAAVAGDPRLAVARDNLGLALLQLGRPAEALASFQVSLELNPGSAKTHNSLGVALLQLARLDDAIAAFQQALALNPAYAQARENLALAENARAAARKDPASPPR